MSVAVLPVVERADGALEAVIVPVTTSDDVEVVDVAALKQTERDVRVGDETKRLVVYEAADGARWVAYDDAL